MDVIENEIHVRLHYLVHIYYRQVIVLGQCVDTRIDTICNNRVGNLPLLCASWDAVAEKYLSLRVDATYGIYHSLIRRRELFCVPLEELSIICSQHYDMNVGMESEHIIELLGRPVWEIAVLHHGSCGASEIEHVVAIAENRIESGRVAVIALVTDAEALCDAVAHASYTHIVLLGARGQEDCDGCERRAYDILHLTQFPL